MEINKEDYVMEFIDGVILVETKTSLPVWAIVVVFILAIISILAGSSALKKAFSNGKYALFCSVVCLVSALCELGIATDFQEPNGKYRVVVTNEVDMDEFQRTYEIVDYKDGVYTIILKAE